MDYQFSKPSYPLSLFVKQYWAIESCLPREQLHIQRIVPHGMMEMMFYLDGKPKSVNGNDIMSGNSLLAGLHSSYYDLAIHEKLSVFAVSFLPHGAKIFFDLPCNEFANQLLQVNYILKTETERLENMLHTATSFSQRVQLIENFLMGRIRNKNEYDFKRIAHTVQRISQSKGMITIPTLSHEACLGRKQFERKFLQFVGNTPRQFLKTVRFQYSLHQKNLSKSMSLTELAHSSGYFDQSHMINDYKFLSGMTPGQYFSICEPYSDFF
jgi:AraC-like DNA-binding protein